jgi:hypothetical protein
MWRRQIETSYGMWMAFSVTVFAVTGSIVGIPVGKSVDVPYWEVWAALLSGKSNHADALVLLIVFWGVIFAVPSIVIGWATQALVKVLAASFRGQPKLQ